MDEYVNEKADFWVIYRFETAPFHHLCVVCVNVCILSSLWLPAARHCVLCNLCMCQRVKISLSLCPCCSDRHIIRSFRDKNTQKAIWSRAQTYTPPDMIDSRSLCPLNLVSRRVRERQEEEILLALKDYNTPTTLPSSRFPSYISSLRATVAPLPFTLSLPHSFVTSLFSNLFLSPMPISARSRKLWGKVDHQ